MAKRTKNLPTQEILGVVIGALGAGAVNKGAEKIPFLANLDPKIRAMIPLALGFGVTMFAKNKAIVKNIGVGMIAKGSFDIVAPIIGIGAPDTIDDNIFMGYNEPIELPADQSILSLPADQSILAGMDNELSEPDEMALFGIDEDNM